MSFDVSQVFLTPIAFERSIRRTRPFVQWTAGTFRGRTAMEAVVQGRHVLVVLKDRRTVMNLSFPIDAKTGLPPALIEKTVESFEFR
jgi:hypothetical protein